MTAAQLIREARLRAGLTQAELAARLGRERAQVARWEIGAQEPSFANLRSVVEACGFTLKVEIGERRSHVNLRDDRCLAEWITDQNRQSALPPPAWAGADAL